MLLGPGERGQGLRALEPHCSGVPASAAWPNGQLTFSQTSSLVGAAGKAVPTSCPTSPPIWEQGSPTVKAWCCL